jgi:hypothetical protein
LALAWAVISPLAAPLALDQPGIDKASTRVVKWCDVVDCQQPRHTAATEAGRRRRSPIAFPAVLHPAMFIHIQALRTEWMSDVPAMTESMFDTVTDPLKTAGIGDHAGMDLDPTTSVAVVESAYRLSQCCWRGG